MFHVSYINSEQRYKIPCFEKTFRRFFCHKSIIHLTRCIFHLDSLHLTTESLWKGRDRSCKTSAARDRGFWSAENTRFSSKTAKMKSRGALRLLPPNDSMPRANNGLVGANDSLAAANDQTVRKRQKIFSTGRAKMRIALRNIPKEACRIAYSR